MLFQAVAAFATVFLGAVSAQQDITSATKPSSTSSAAVVTHTAAVGSTGHHFEPSEIRAKVGDIIEFRFYPQNHSVARAAYKQACIPYEYTGPGRVGFWSGFFPTQLVLPDPPKFQVRVNDTEPIFFYCSAPSACEDGMVGVVNANATQTFETQHAFAVNSTDSFSPGENPFPPEVARTSTSTTATPSATSSPAATSSAAVPPPAASGSHGLSPGAIAGIAIAGVVVLLLAIAVIYMLGRQKSIHDMLRRHSAAPNPTVYQPASPGFAEAHYPNVAKAGPMSTISSGRWSETPYGGVAVGASTEDGRSYRSASPPNDERAGMIMNPSGWPSPRSEAAPGLLPSPGYSTWEEREAGQHKPTPQPYVPEQHYGPHELAAPGGVAPPPNSALSPQDRPFSYTDSEVGYAGHQRDTYR